MTIAAKYENGVFKPLESVKIEEGTIVEVTVPSYAEHLSGKPRSVKDFAFYGMWKDRTDIGDSVDYVNEQRSASRRSADGSGARNTARGGPDARHNVYDGEIGASRQPLA